MFKGNRDRHYQLMEELAALEAREEGIGAAQVVSPPTQKPSIGKVAVFLAGVGAAIYFFAFSGKSPFDESEEDKVEKPNTGKDESKKLIEQIKLGKMNDVGEEKLSK